MKILTILLILLQINTFGYGNYSSPYSNRYNSYSSVPVEQTNRKIGYTTNYGNTFGYTTQQTYYQGTYTPAASSFGGSGRPGQPRRVKGYTADGDSIDTGSGEQGNPDPMWEDGYEYYRDGKNWYRWNGKRGWEWLSITGLYYHWSIFSHDVPTGATQYYEQNPVPIGDPDFYLITALLFSYFIYIYMKKRRQQFLLYTGIKR